MLFGALNIYKCPDALAYDVPCVDITLTMMQTKHRPKCLALLSLLNAPVRDDKQTHRLIFELYTSL